MLSFCALAASNESKEIDNKIAALIKNLNINNVNAKELSSALAAIIKTIVNFEKTQEIKQQEEQSINNKNFPDEDHLKQHIISAMSNLDYSAISKIYISIKIWIETLSSDLKNLDAVWHNADLEDAYKKLEKTAVFDQLSELLSTLYIVHTILILGITNKNSIEIINNVSSSFPAQVKHYIASIMQRFSDTLKKDSKDKIIVEFYSLVFQILRKKSDILTVNYKNCLIDLEYILGKMTEFVKLIKQESTSTRYSQDMNNASAAIAEVLSDKILQLDNITKDFKLVCTEALKTSENVLKQIEKSKIIPTSSTQAAENNNGLLSFLKKKENNES